MKTERPPAPRSILLLTALSIAAQGSLSAGINDWINVGPVVGGFFRMAVDPQNPDIIYGIYGGTLVGVFKSKDGGASWNNAGLNGFSVGALIIDPQKSTTLYAVTSGPDEYGDPIRVFKSTDGGASWNESDSGLPGCCTDTLAIDPQNTGTLYATTGGYNARALFKSTDAGTSWSMIYGFSPGTYFGDLAIDPKTPGTLYLAIESGGAAMFKSVDGGTSWSAADAGLPGGSAYALTIDPTSPGTIYATTSGGVYKTADGAASWHAANSGLPIRSGISLCCGGVVIDPRNSNTLYTVTDNDAPFKSTDGGASWNAVGSGLVPGLRSADSRSTREAPAPYTQPHRMACTGAPMEASALPHTPGCEPFQSSRWRWIRNAQALYWPEALRPRTPA